jgi:Cu/Ag efflux pump CusA
MSDRAVVAGLVIAALFALIVLAGSALVWLAVVSGHQPTPAQEALIALADWTVKAAVGALLGFAGGVGLARRNGAVAVENT